MSGTTQAERERMLIEGRAARDRLILIGRNDYLNACNTARNAMPADAQTIDVNDLIACRAALAAASGYLDRIEEQLPARRMHVRGRDDR